MIASNKSTTIIVGATPYRLFRGIISWIKRIINFALTKNGSRFIGLSLSVFVRQYFYDKKLKKFFIIKIRDWTDYLTLTQIFYGDDYGLEKLTRHYELVEFYKTIIRLGKRPLIIDCGGNIGLASRYFSDNYPSSKILCIEPDNCNITQAKINNNSEVEFFECAIGSANGHGDIIDTGRGNWGYQIKGDINGLIEIISVNSLLERYSDDQFIPFIIKIDIEGFESELFSQNLEWISKFPLIIIELHDWMLPKTANSCNFLKAVGGLDRDFVFYGENVFSISNTLI